MTLLLLCMAGTFACAGQTHRADSLLKVVTQIQPDTAKVKVLLDIAREFRGIDAPKEFYYANEALALSEKTGWDHGQAWSEQLLGDAYLQVLAYDDAITHLKRSIAKEPEKGTSYTERFCLQLMVHCYHMLDRLEASAACQKQLLDLTTSTGDRLNECNQMSAYAQCLSNMGKYQEAIAWLQKDIRLANSSFQGTQQLDVVADLLNTLATAYVKVSATDSALICLRTAADYARQTGNKFLASYILSSFCDVYAATKVYDSAIYYGELAVKEAEVLQEIKLAQAYSEILSQLYSANNHPANALSNRIKSDSLSRIINHTEETMDQAMQLTKISMEQQASHNQLEKRSLEAVRKKQEAYLVATLIALFALAAFTLLVYRNLRQKQKANRIISEQATSLQEQNELIDQALKDKQVMLEETHHRIKNNLQLISSLLELQVADMEDEYTKNALRNTQRRIQSIAAVHSALSGTGEGAVIEFSAFAADLFVRLNNAFSDKDKAVRLVNEIQPVHLPLQTAVLLGLILNELLTNSFKHAFAKVDEPIVRISLAGDGQNNTMRYHDNGPGLPVAKFDAQSGSLGLYLVRRISKQLKGTASYNFDAGSTFIINFRDAGN